MLISIGATKGSGTTKLPSAAAALAGDGCLEGDLILGPC
jgi:hypothetical protein